MSSRILFTQTPQGKQIIAAVCEHNRKRLLSYGKIQEDAPDKCYNYLEAHPEIVLDIITEFTSWSNEFFKAQRRTDETKARLTLIGICLAIIHFYYENKDMWALQLYQKLCAHIEKSFRSTKNDFFWVDFFLLCDQKRLPLTESIRTAYLRFNESIRPLSGLTPDIFPNVSVVIKDIMTLYSRMTAFDLADLLFSQVQMLPAKNKAAFVCELMASNVELAKEVAILFLLNPDQTARQQIVIALLDLCRKKSTCLVTPNSMYRLLTICNCWPEEDRGLLGVLIAHQREKLAHVLEPVPAKLSAIYASMINSMGIQIFIFKFQIARGKYQVCELLIKTGIGIRKTLIKEVSRYEVENIIKTKFSKDRAQNGSFKAVDLHYATKIIFHHIVVDNQNGGVPAFKLLKLVELLALDLTQWPRKRLKFDDELAALLQAEKNITTENFIAASLKRSARWHEKKDFAEFWFEIGEQVDKRVNQHTQIIKGRQYIDKPKAMSVIFLEVLEPLRTKWQEDFILMALWAKAKPRKGECLWQDFAILAHCLFQGKPLDTIPFMQKMCEITLIASLQTMVNRDAHLSLTE